MSTPAQEQIMHKPMSPGPVVVAIDGSNAAIGAAEWAAKEALHQDVPLRLVHVVKVTDEKAYAADPHPIENEYAETCLHAACSAVKESGLPIRVETAMLRGEIDSTLIEESKGATLICLGSTGIGRIAAAVLGSTAATVAERARCPVAIIRRTHDQPLPDAGFIAVILDGRTGNEEAMRWAMEEARVRQAPVLALGAWPWPLFGIDYERFDRQLDHWLHRYPDVKVEVASTRMSAIRYLEGYIGALQLVVIGSRNARQAMDLVGPHTLSALAHADCSVLVAREPVQSTDSPRDYRRSLEADRIAL
jgi:nucleotide-binding universal stress UspA family protein